MSNRRKKIRRMLDAIDEHLKAQPSPVDELLARVVRLLAQEVDALRKGDATPEPAQNTPEEDALLRRMLEG